MTEPTVNGAAVEPTVEPTVFSAAELGAEPAVEAPPEPAPPVLELREPLPPVVDDDVGLAAVARRFAAGTGPVAVDAERASGYRYSQRAYLVQVRRAGAGTALLDPVAAGAVPNDWLRPFAEAVGDDTEWVIHAASQDLPCLAELGLRPRRLFDTELAGRLLDYPRVGLAVLVEELVGASMRKEHSAVDWSRRPLPEPWLDYAALDVEVLVELRDVLADQLESAGKAEWARQEFERWLSAAPPAPRAEPWRRTSGIHHVRGRRGLGVLRELWQTRDSIARRRDLAPSKIIRDPSLVAAAQSLPRDREALAKVQGFGHRPVERHLKDFVTAVQRGLALPDAQLPTLATPHDGPPPARVWASKFPEAATRLGACRERVAEIAGGIAVPQENLLEPEAVRRLAWDPPAPLTAAAVAERLRSAGARQWQIEHTADALTEVLLAIP